MDADELLTLAAGQHGLVRRADARAVFSRKALSRRLARGDWVADGPRVLRRSGAPDTPALRAMRAVLDAGPGAYLSHGTAAAWWGLPGFDLLRPHVTRPRNISGLAVGFGQRLHEVLALGTDQVTVLDGVPVVRPERLSFELMASVHPMRAERAVETAWSKGLVSGASLRHVFRQLEGQGRAGTVRMRDFLERHADDWVPPASGLEARFKRLTEEHRLGSFRRQVDLGAERWVGRVDFLRDDMPLVVEVQSERYHAALLDRVHDAARRAALEAAGFVVVEVWDTAVWHDRHGVVAAVRAGIRRARAAQHPAA